MAFLRNRIFKNREMFPFIASLFLRLLQFLPPPPSEPSVGARLTEIAGGDSCIAFQSLFLLQVIRQDVPGPLTEEISLKNSIQKALCCGFS